MRAAARFVLWSLAGMLALGILRGQSSDL